MQQHISAILTGRNLGPLTIWGNPHRAPKQCWESFFHKLVADDRHVIEIRVNQCPGGMFCSLPVCLDIKDTGEIYQLESFPEWKKRILHGSVESLHDEENDNTDCYHKHFERKEIADNDTPPDLNKHRTGKTSTSLKPPKQTTSSPQFCWWLSGDGVVAESLQFDQCCSKELADSEMDISTTFSTFPSAEAIMKRFTNIEYLEDIIKEILQEHKGDNGVAVFLEKISDTKFPEYVILKDVTPVHHVFDLVILKEKQPPVIVTIFQNKCSPEEAKKYCLQLGQLLKRGCSKYAGSDKSSMKFFFQCRLYFIGHGYVNLQQEGCYPKDYQHPTAETLNTVRHALARILLESQLITDRYGNIMVRHLSSYQAKVLLGRRAKVLIVKAIAGSGKTVLAIEMAHRLKQRYGNTRKIVFLCRSRGLAAFVKSQAICINLFESVIECNSQRDTDLSASFFSQYTDIIIDDAHAIPVVGEPTSWTIYNALFSSLQKRPGHAYIFLDPDMQNYRGCTPDDFAFQLETLAGRFVGKYNVQVEPLGKILRNSRRICQFTKACMGTGKYVDELSTVRHLPEDGVFFHNIQGRDAGQYEATTLLSRLSNVKQYSNHDVAILTNNKEDKIWVKEMLLEKGHTTQDARPPVKNLVVDTLENFKALKPRAIFFIIPQSWDSDYVTSVNSLLPVVTRAKSRLEFLLLWDPSQRQQNLTELKKAISVAVSTLAQCIK